MSYICTNGNILFTGNMCPRFCSGHHFQDTTAAGNGYQCDTHGCGAELVPDGPPGKEHGKKRIVSGGTSIKYRRSKGRTQKNQKKKWYVKKSI